MEIATVFSSRPLFPGIKGPDPDPKKVLEHLCFEKLFPVLDGLPDLSTWSEVGEEGTDT